MDTMKKIGFHQLYIKILALCFCLILVGASCCVFVLARAVRQTKIIYDASTKKLLDVESKALFANMKAVSAHVTRLCSSPDFRKTLMQQALKNSAVPDVHALSAMSTLIDNALNGLRHVRSCMIHTSHGNYFHLAQGYRKNFDFNSTELARKMSSQNDGGVWYGVSQRDEFYQFSGDVIPIVYRFTYNSPQENVAVVVLLDEWSLYTSLNNQYGNQGRTLLINRRGEQVFRMRSAGLENIGTKNGKSILETDKDTRTLDKDGHEYILHYGAAGTEIPWRLVMLTDRENLMSSLRPAVYVIILILLGVIAFSIFIAITVSGSITKPIAELSRAMSAVHTLPVQVKLKSSYKGEAGLLAKKFNQMMDQLNLYANQLKEEKEHVKIEQLLKRRAELKALQAQINPHFLYNTLDSISWMAYQAGEEKISGMTVALAELFRVSLNRGNELISLENEFRHVESYLKIQKMRYEDRFDYECNLPQELKNFYTVKLLLQPLVENSIYHGIREMKQKGYIRVLACKGKDNSLILTVEDNGTDFPVEKMEKINRNLQDGLVEDKDSYGIYNVNERIRLYFGRQWGLRYEKSQKNTLAVISIPAAGEEFLKEDAAYFNH